MPFDLETPEERRLQNERLDALEAQMRVVLLVLRGLEWASREQALNILQVTSPTLKTLGDKGIIECRKGKRKVEYELCSLVNYALRKGSRSSFMQHPPLAKLFTQLTAA